MPAKRKSRALRVVLPLAIVLIAAAATAFYLRQRKPEPLVLSGTLEARTVNVGFYMGADPASAKRHEELFQQHWSKDTRAIKGFLFGTTREATDVVTSYASLGAHRVNIVLRQGPYDWEALDAFASDVMPQFA